MKLSSRIKPISYLKAHAAEIVRTLGDRRDMRALLERRLLRAQAPY